MHQTDNAHRGVIFESDAVRAEQGSARYPRDERAISLWRIRRRRCRFIHQQTDVRAGCQRTSMSAAYRGSGASLRRTFAA
jgi:hypothetical protein